MFSEKYFLVVKGRDVEIFLIFYTVVLSNKFVCIFFRSLVTFIRLKSYFAAIQVTDIRLTQILVAR
jgi:hypothetical protein